MTRSTSIPSDPRRGALPLLFAVRAAGDPATVAQYARTTSELDAKIISDRHAKVRIEPVRWSAP